MKLAVFGATGGVGRQVVTQALDAGHEVRAYVRNPAKLDLTHPHLTVIAGQLTDRDAVQRAVNGTDAVISALGPSLERKATGMPLVDGTRTILDAMRTEGIERYIGTATPSLRDPRDTSSVLGRIVPFMGRTLFPPAYRELLAMSQLPMVGGPAADVGGGVGRGGRSGPPRELLEGWRSADRPLSAVLS